ncbi:MAG: hypothetical protein CM1200mP18_13260 [Gammaproteobacteria bacterium]|nr:MAG: hypothetical protein CM1200mP18_13260 [Gammaproteobacteria bacterium]
MCCFPRFGRALRAGSDGGDHTETRDVTIDPEKLIRFLDQRMAYFMIPRYIEFTAAIPKTPTGKMEKYKLRSKGITPSPWDRVAAGIKLSR